jgi:hypothetical protein
MHMSSTTENYSAAVQKVTDFWTQGSQGLGDFTLPSLQQIDLVPAVERYFEFVQQAVDVSRDFTLKWAQAVGSLPGAAREQA